MLRDSVELTTRALKKLGYLDTRFNADVAEAMLAFINRPQNKHQLRKLEMLPSPLDKQPDVDAKLRSALLSQSTKGRWQTPATDIEVREFLEQRNLLSSGKAHPKLVLEAMQKYAQQEGLPTRKTYNLNAFQVLFHANKNPTKAGLVDFQT